MSCSIPAALRGALAGLAALTLSAVAATAPASAQDRRQNTPGEFDYYVLSLS
jgi:ribonuclease T2